MNKYADVEEKSNSGRMSRASSSAFQSRLDNARRTQADNLLVSEVIPSSGSEF